MGSTYVRLLQDLKIEVNGISLSLPYKGQSVAIYRQKHKIKLDAFAHVGKPFVTFFWIADSELQTLIYAIG